VFAEVLVAEVLNRNDHERAFAESDAGRIALQAVERSLETDKPVDHEMLEFIQERARGTGAATALLEAAPSVRNARKQKQALIERNRTVERHAKTKHEKYRNLVQTLRAGDPQLSLWGAATKVAQQFKVDPRTVYRALTRK
jgi:predicted negative regulator of RcsB-dependent stress response